MASPSVSVPSADPLDCPCGDACDALAWHRKRIAELEQQVASDCLTGLWNRAHFERQIDVELDRSRRYRQPVSMILFDVDHFKRVNDVHGHQAGDAVLRELALTAQSALRASDALFRWGGEEFAILAPSTGHRGAYRLAEALRLRVAGAAFPAVGRLTISAGVAEHVDAEGGNAWFRRADAMLYGAKREGRNCVRADTRGNSDAWAEAQGPASLHLVWQEGFESGMPAIDSEHRELFDQANALLDATLLADAPDGAAAKAFDGLIDRIAAHFRHEEELLDLHGFKALDAHRRAHAGLLARARELRQSWAAGITGPGALVEFLAGDVVARHLLKADREFFPLFAREGTSAKG
ncbi:MAG: diguanylate cyclase [Rhodocyclaceae bacterium]|jgi:diguanylate cyclase (GGDEF)-like protein/hemerythrin-like metal-binding protein